jgi:UDP-N-acetylglucosamine transferase subunit ALG13
VIFVTVGTQLPFERMVATVDAWAARQSPAPNILAQVGDGRTDYMSLRCVHSLDGESYQTAVSEARLIVAHAGTGSILTALDHGVPVIVMPRDHLRGEHRDDHQQQTARQLEKMGLVAVAWDEAALPRLIEATLARASEGRAARQRSTELVDYIRTYVQGVLGKQPRVTRSPASSPDT